jgi:integrase
MARTQIESPAPAPHSVTPEPTEAEWPRKVRVGPHEIRIYRDKLPSGAVSYRVEDRTGPQRRLLRFKTIDAAEKAAKDVGRRLRDPARLTSLVSAQQASEYLNLCGVVGNLNLLTLVTMAVEAVKVLGGRLDDLLPAAREHANRHVRISEERELKDAVDEYLKVKAAEHLRPRSLEDLRFHLGSLAAAFSGPVSQVTTSSLSRWLESLKVGPLSKRKKLTVYGQFFRWCGQRGYSDPKENPADGIRKPKVRNDHEPATYTANQLREMLDKAEPRFRNLIALMAFAGLRPMEAQRLHWEQISWGEEYIHLSPRGSKTRSARRVPVLAPLQDWLQDTPVRGPIWPLSDVAIKRTRAALIRQLSFEWIPDGLRHSWISYRLVLTPNEGQVAMEAGNSPEVLFKHYRAIKNKTEAEAWFAVRPHDTSDTLRHTVTAAA